MKIAICDDSREIRIETAELIKKICPESTMDFFRSGEEMTDSKKEYDIIFLDIAMENISGIDAAKNLRRRQEENGGKKSLIIFITAFKDYMEDAFDVNAFHYLVKPIDPEKFAKVFSMALKEINYSESTDHIMVKSGKLRKKLSLSDILYVESNNKKAVFHTKTGNYEIYGKMEELETKLGSRFFRCHRCFLVNMENICAYGFDEITVLNGEKLLLSKKKYPEFVKAYLRYAKDGGIVNV